MDFDSVLKVSVFHGPLIRGRQKVTFSTVIGGFPSILSYLKVSVFYGPLIADVQIFKLRLTAAKTQPLVI